MDSSESLNQKRKVFQALYEKPLTMYECDKVTGVNRSNICWYFRDFREEGKLYLIRKRKCNISNHIAGEYTTNIDLVPEDDERPPIQLSLL